MPDAVLAFIDQENAAYMHLEQVGRCCLVLA